MKKLLSNTNPFALVLVPVLFAMVMGLSGQLNQQSNTVQNAAGATYTRATSLFSKSVSLFKSVCSINKQNVW